MRRALRLSAWLRGAIGLTAWAAVATLAACMSKTPPPSEAPGQWFYKTDAALGPMALYGPPNTEPYVTIRCARTQRRVVFERVGVPAGNPVRLLTVRFGDQRHTLQATTTDATLPLVEASVPVTTAWLSDLSASNAPIDVISVDTIRVPAAPQIAKVINLCKADSAV